MDNYDYCAAWAQRIGGRILDYGCGTGGLVDKMRSVGIDAHGCDVFYDGGDFSSMKPSPFIRRMEGDVIPFPDAHFDAVVSNQVLEHVPDLGVVTREMARVLKPGGVALHLFPHRGVIVEPHIRVPFAHRFRKGAAWRLQWIALMRALRYGRAAWPLMEVSATRLAWMDAWTHYRSRQELDAELGRAFTVEHIEDDWLDARLGAIPAPRALKRMAVRKWAGVVMLATKHS